VQVNDALKEHPEVINSDPYGKGWMLVIELTNPADVNQMMSAEQYQSFLGSQPN
jgi:glycine cleavage system H protein